jgi:hypothetical protein
MFFHISIHRIKAHRVFDHPWDPFNRSVELYQTWHLAALEKMDETSPASWARVGCSARGAPDDGTSFREGTDLIVVDPQITLGVDPDAIKDKLQSHFRLDFHHWESDPGSGTEKVRSAFTDMTLQYMVNAWRAAGEDATKARAALDAWVSANWKDAVKAIAVAAAPAGPWIEVGSNLLPVVDLLVGMLKEQGDKYFGQHRFILQHRGNNETLQWQVTAPNGTPSGWKNGQGRHETEVRVIDGPGKNILDVTYRFQLIE